MRPGQGQAASTRLGNNTYSDEPRPLFLLLLRRCLWPTVGRCVSCAPAAAPAGAGRSVACVSYRGRLALRAVGGVVECGRRWAPAPLSAASCWHHASSSSHCEERCRRAEGDGRARGGKAKDRGDLCVLKVCKSAYLSVLVQRRSSAQCGVSRGRRLRLRHCGQPGHTMCAKRCFCETGGEQEGDRPGNTRAHAH